MKWIMGTASFSASEPVICFGKVETSAAFCDFAKLSASSIAEGLKRTSASVKRSHWPRALFAICQQACCLPFQPFGSSTVGMRRTLSF